MASISDGIIYYEKNIIRSLDNWNILNNASINNGVITIHSKGMCGIDLSNEYCNGLKASKYRRAIFVIDTNVSNENNYQNYIELLLKCIYKDSDGNRIQEIISVNSTQLESIDTEEGRQYTRIIEMENFDLESCTVYVVNNSTEPIILKSCEIKRSQDISSSQVGESIGLSITLQEVAEYLDGIELYYSGVSKPDKLWWMDDENDQLCGVNVNNERMIKLSRHNTILLD